MQMPQYADNFAFFMHRVHSYLFIFWFCQLIFFSSSVMAENFCTEIKVKVMGTIHKLVLRLFNGYSLSHCEVIY